MIQFEQAHHRTFQIEAVERVSKAFGRAVREHGALLNQNQTARLVGVSRSRVNAWVAKGQVKTVTVLDPATNEPIGEYVTSQSLRDYLAKSQA